jgi:hypothetical protein
MPIDNLIKLNLFYRKTESQDFLQEIPNSGIQPIERSFNFIYSIPLYNSCDNSIVGMCKLVGNDTTFDNQSKLLATLSMTFFLKNGSLTFYTNDVENFKPDPSTGTVYFPADLTIPLTFVYGTGDYYKADVKYSSLVPLADVNKTRVIEIIIQK